MHHHKRLHALWSVNVVFLPNGLLMMHMHCTMTSACGLWI